MDVEYANSELERLAEDATYLGNHSAAKILKYRNRINRIRQAVNRLDLYAQKSLRLEKLKGQRQHQHSMRLNDQYRLIVEFQKRSGKEIVKVINLEDYH